MVLSFIHPATCGFARGATWYISKQLDKEWKFGDSEHCSQLKGTCSITIRYNRFNAVFESCKENFPIDFKGFRKILPDLRKTFAYGIDVKYKNATNTQPLSTLKAGKPYLRRRRAAHF